MKSFQNQGFYLIRARIYLTQSTDSDRVIYLEYTLHSRAFEGIQEART